MSTITQAQLNAQSKALLTKMLKLSKSGPHLENIYIQSVGDIVTATATNLDQTMRVILNPGLDSVYGSAGFEGDPVNHLFNAEDFVKLRRLDITAPLRFEYTDADSKTDMSGVLHIGRYSIKTSEMPVDEFPFIEQEANLKWVKLSAGMIHAVNPVIPASATQDVRHHLNGMLIDHSAVVATDGARMHSFNIDTGIDRDHKQMIVPVDMLKLIDLKQPDTRFSYAQEYINPKGPNGRQAKPRVMVRVNQNNVVYTSRTVDGTFPDYQRALDMASDHVEFTADPSVMVRELGALKPCMPYNNMCRVRVDQGTDVMHLSVKNANTSAKGEVQLNPQQMSGFTHKDTIGVNAVLLEEAVANVPDINDTVTIRLKDKDTVLMVVQGDYSGLVMPIRLPEHMKAKAA